MQVEINKQEAMLAAKQELEDRYFEIEALFDLADDLTNTVESDFVKDPQAQFQLIEPLADQLADSADILSEEFVAIAEAHVEGRGKEEGNKRRSRIESALRKVYMAMNSYKDAAQEMASEQYNAVRNIADPIVKKIKRQMETVVALLVEFVDLSLDRIMHKSEIEELKQRQEKIAMMLHSIAHQPSAP